MVNRFRIASSLVRKLEELGVPPAEVLCQARLPAGLLDQERILVSTEELFAFYRGLAQTSRDPAIGLKLGTEGRIERYDPIVVDASFAVAAVLPNPRQEAALRCFSDWYQEGPWHLGRVGVDSGCP